MHENMSFVYITQIVTPRHPEALQIQPSKLRVSSRIDGHGQYLYPLTATSILFSLTYSSLYLVYQGNLPTVPESTSTVNTARDVTPIMVISQTIPYSMPS